MATTTVVPPVAPPTEADDFLTIEQFAELIAMTRRYVEGLLEQRRIGSVRFGNRVRIPVSEVRRLLADGWTPPETP